MTTEGGTQGRGLLGGGYMKKVADDESNRRKKGRGEEIVGLCLGGAVSPRSRKKKKGLYKKAKGGRA